MKAAPRYRFRRLPGPTTEMYYRVSVTYADGWRATVGTVRYFFIRHLNQHGWEATGPDGHLGVHQHRWQSAWALTWDRKGYPFPVAFSHKREII